MISREFDLISLVRIALSASDAEGVLTESQKADMTSDFETVACEIDGYQAQQRQAVAARGEQIVQGLRMASRFASTTSPRATRSEGMEPRRAPVASTAGLFYG